jgi:transcriptional regulator with XRE-family HTH domain
MLLTITSAPRRGEAWCVHDEETIQAWKQAFGRRVRGLRKARGIKQDTLAVALHYSSRTSISHIERGREDPPLTKILACAKELGVQPHELFLREPHEEAVAAVADQLPPLLRHLLAIWQTLAEEDRGALMGYAEVLQRGDAELRQSARAHLRVLRRAMHEQGGADDSSEADGAPAS